MNEPSQQARMATMVWASMLGAVGLYAALPVLIGREPGAAGEGMALRVVLGAAAAGFGIASFAAKRRIARVAARAPAGRGQTLALVASLVAWAASEAVALQGVALYLVAGDARWLWACCAGAALLLAVHAPQRAQARDPRTLARPDVRIG